MPYLIGGAVAIGLSLGFFGSGGSILTVPVLVYLLEHDPKIAIAESLAIVGLIAFFGSIPYARAGLVDRRSVLWFGAPGMAGTYVGAWIGGMVPAAVQLIVFAGVMLSAAVLMARRSGRPVESETPAGEAEAKRALGRIVSDGLAVGALTGFVGVGGGFLIVPALVLLARLEMRVAIGTSLVIIALKSATGFFKYYSVLSATGTTVDVKAITAFAVVGALGAFGGRRLQGYLNAQRLQASFALFLVVMALFILVREI